MLGISLSGVFIIVFLLYLLYCKYKENIILCYEVEKIKKVKKEKLDLCEDETTKNTPEKSRQLYDKMNSIVQKNLGISLRDMVLGKK